MNGNRVTTPRHYFLGAAALIAAGLVLGLGLSAGLNLPRVSHAAREVTKARFPVHVTKRVRSDVTPLRNFELCAVLRKAIGEVGK